MAKYADLNQIVLEYKISREGCVKELRELQKQLSNVPVLLDLFEKYLKDIDCEFSELITRAEFYNPQMRIPLLDELVEHDEADDITERMVLPLPIIYIHSESISDTFYRNTKRRLGKLILPDKRDSSSRVLSRPDCSGIAVIYERGKKLHYIEMILTKDFL